MPVGFLWTKLPLQPLHIQGIFSPAEVLLALLEMSPAPDRPGPQVALWSCTVSPFCRPDRPQRTNVVDPLSPGELLSGRKPTKSSQPHNLISTIHTGGKAGADWTRRELSASCQYSGLLYERTSRDRSPRQAASIRVGE